MSKTRWERRRLRKRLYFLLVLTLALLVSVLIGAAVRYGMYVTDRAVRSREAFRQTEPVSYMPADFDREAYAEALMRFEQEQSPALYEALYGQKKSADQRALVGTGSGLRAEP